MSEASKPASLVGLALADEQQLALPTTGPAANSAIVPFDTSGDSSTATIVEAVGRPAQGAVARADGTLSFRDPNASDTHTVAVRFDAAASTVPTTLGAMTAVVSADSTGGGPGRITWTYTALAGRLERLAAGQTVHEVFDLVLADGHGGTLVEPVTVTLVGTNDAPVLSYTAGDTNVALVRAPPADGSTQDAVLTASGTGTFTDADLTDTHTVSSRFDAAASTLATALGTLTPTVTADSTGGANGRVTWSYAVSAAGLQGLPVGQTIRQAYDLTLADGHGGTLEQRVTVLLVNSDDAPVLVPTGRSDAATIVNAVGEPTPGALFTASGSNGFTDADLTDTHTVSVAFDPKASQKTAPLGRLVPVVTTDSTGGGVGQVTWTYTVSPASLAALLLGQTSQDVFDVTVRDGSMQATTFPVTVTLVGTTPPPAAVVPPADSVSASLIGNPKVSALSADGSFRFSDSTGGPYTTVVTPAQGDVGSLSASTEGPYSQRVTWSYIVSEAAVQGLAADRTDTFAILLNDGIGQVAEQTVSVTLHNPGSATVATLTAGQDNVVAPPTGILVRATPATLNPGDSLVGGPGPDILALTGSGVYRFDQLAAFTGIDLVTLNDESDAEFDLGSQNLTLTSTSFANQSILLGSGAVHLTAGGGDGPVISSANPSDWNPDNRISASYGNGDLILNAGHSPDARYDLTTNSLTRLGRVYGEGDGLTLKVGAGTLTGVTNLLGTGSNNVLTTSDASLDLSHTQVLGFSIQTTNAGGTTFTVRSASTGLAVVGGPGQDTVAAPGVDFTSDQIATLFADSIETVVDRSGTYQKSAPLAVLDVTERLRSETGTSSTDRITSLPAVTGFTAPNARLTVTTDGSLQPGTISADASGAWSYVPVGLADGQHTIGVTAIDDAGVTGSASLAFTLDTTPPTIHVTSSGGPVATPAITVTGTADAADAGATVTVLAGSAAAGTGVVGQDGSWSAGVVLPDADDTVVADVTDAAGHTAFSNAVSLSVLQDRPVFINPLGGDWNLGANWSTGLVPTAPDEVTISRPVAVTLSTGIATVQQIAAGAASRLAVAANAALTVADTASFGTLAVDGGAVTLNGTSTIGTLALSSGVLAGSGFETVSGSLTMVGGTLVGSGEITLPQKAPLTVGAAGAPSTEHLGRTLFAMGQSVLTNTDLDLDAHDSATQAVMPGYLIIGQFGRLSIDDTAAISDQTGGSDGVMLYGTLSKTGPGTTTIQAPLTAAGTVNVASGTLDLAGGGLFAGTVSIDADAALDLRAGTFTVYRGTAFTGQGPVELSGGTLNVIGAVNLPTLVQSAGTVSGSANASVTGRLDWTGGDMSGSGHMAVGPSGSLTLGMPGGTGTETLGRELDLLGTGTLTGSTLHLGDALPAGPVSPGTLAIKAGGSLTLDGTAAIVTTTAGTGSLSNAGTLTKTGTGAARIEAALTNTGTLAVQEGELALSGSATNTGGITIAGGASLIVGPDLTGSGFVDLNGPGSLLELSGASANTVAFGIGAGATLQLDHAAAFTGQITGFAASSTLDLSDMRAATATLSYTPGQDEGTLAVSDGTHIAHLALAGAFTAADFTVATDKTGGTLIHLRG